MRRFAVALLVVLPVVAGCVGQVSDPADLDVTNSSEGPELGLASDLPVERDAEPTLEAPPSWAVGEWWHVRLRSGTFEQDVEFDRVVAGEEPGNYLVGMGTDAWEDVALVLHFPGFGQVDRTTLGFEAHDLMFEPLRFPLTEGKTWETQWYSGDPLHAQVTSIDGARATVQMEGAQVVELVYDAEMATITSMQVDGYMRFEVTDHGFRYPGEVRVPYGHDLVFCHGRAAVAVPITPCALDVGGADVPIETIDIPSEYDAASAALLMADLEPTGPAGKGAYALQVEAPGGSSYSAEKLPTDGTIEIVPFGHEPASGTWEVTAVAGGPGLAILEGVAYRSLEIQAPAGAG